MAIRGEIAGRFERGKNLFGHLLTKGQSHLRVLRRGLKFFEHQAGLDFMVVLILAGTVLTNVADYCVVEDLADRQAGIDPDRVRRIQLQGPVPAEANITEARGHMYEQTQTAD